jgi:hypothetical protein
MENGVILVFGLILSSGCEVGDRSLTSLPVGLFPYELSGDARR